MRNSALVMLLTTLVAGLQAAVYQGDAFDFPQPDGSQVAVRIWGDEFSIASETPEGWAIVQDAGGWWCYAQPGGAGIAPSALRVGAGNPATLGVAKHLRPSPAQRKTVADAQRVRLSRDARGRVESPARRAAQPGAAPVRYSPGQTTLGTRTGVTLLVRFPDRLSDATITRTQVDDYCNGSAYTEFGNKGSIKQYFTDNSLGRLTYSNIVLDYHTMSQPRTYYAQVTPAAGTDPIQELIIENLAAADAAGFDFRQCDGNNDGVIDGINIFYAGTCPNSWAQGLWPHMSTISWTSNDGVSAQVYQMTDMTNQLTIGTFCHENGHMICGFPDIYDYDYDSIGGAGRFSLMNSGGRGANPARIDGYLALSCGWRDPVDLAGSDAETLTLDAEAATILRYRKPGVLTEYFLMENRWTGSASGRDASLPCSGLAIWHCDELGDHNDQRYAKNAQHNNYEVALVQADNLRDFENNRNPGDSGDSGDLWYTGNPAPTYTGSFNDGNGSDPTANDARWWDGTASGLDLSEPSAPGQTISFIGGRSSLSLTSATYTVTEGNSGTTYAQIQVRRAGSRRGAVTLNWSTADSTASVAGHDYLTASGTVTWVDGETGIKSFPVPVLGDTMSEADETVVINVTAAGASVPIPTAMLTIVNDDGTIPYAGSLELTTYALSVTEGSSGLTSSVPIPVRRRGGSSGEVSVAWSTAGTAATSGILTWANGDAADKYILVPVLADSDPEGDEAVTITLGAATGGPAVPTPNQAVLTILNDDYAVSFLSRTASLAEPANAIGNGTVAVQLIGQLHGTVSVDYRWLTTGTATPDLDYVTQSPGTLTWSPGSSVYQMISIPVYADNEADGGETVQIALRNPVGASLREPTTVTVTIRDYLPSGSAADSAHAGGTGSASMCGAGGLAGLICLGGLAGLGLLRRRRR